jgi:hypothetical protein
VPPSRRHNATGKAARFVIVILKTRHHFPDPAPNPAEALNDAIESWIIASDLADARQQAEAQREFALAGKLHRLASQPPGRHVFLGDFVVLTT